MTTTEKYRGWTLEVQYILTADEEQFFACAGDDTDPGYLRSDGLRFTDLAEAMTWLRYKVDQVITQDEAMFAENDAEHGDREGTIRCSRFHADR